MFTLQTIRKRQMSALGHKRTLSSVSVMSALPPIADIGSRVLGKPAQAYPPQKEGGADMDTIIRSELDSQITQSRYKGKLTGAKPPLRPKHVWAVRTRLQLANRLRDLALFDLAIDSKLRGCDVVALKVVEVAPHGICGRSSIRSPTQNGKARSLRDHGANAPSDRRLSPPTGRRVQSIPISGTRPGRSSEHAAVRKTVS
jgi:hypothetical protein